MRSRQLLVAYIVASSLLAVLACAGDPAAPPVESDLVVSTARAPATLAVTSAAPDSATQDTTLDVTINGSGFASGAIAAWGLNGVEDPGQIRTNSTRYVNSRQLVANITVSATATIGKWDIMVKSGPKTGIGTEMFAIKMTGQAADPVSGAIFISTAAGLNFRGDGLAAYAEPDGSSRYKELECGAHVHVWNAPTASGDVTFDSFITGGAKPRCAAYPRKTRITYERVNADGSTTAEGSETVTIFVNVNKLYHSGGAVVPIGGAWEERNMLIDPPAGKCDQIRFRPVLLNGVATGADVVEVRRTAADTWEVRSKADAIGVNGETIHNDKAWCSTNGALYHMPVALTVKSLVPISP